MQKKKILIIICCIVCAILYLVVTKESQSTDIIYMKEEQESEKAEQEVNPKISSQLESIKKNTTPKVEENYIYVHICGAVKKEDVYRLSKGARVYEALAMAGGLANNGESSKVNLARIIVDGESIYFPMKGEKIKANDDGIVNINTCTKEDLMKLPGIGEAKAGDIIEYREKNGGFTKTEEIMKISGIKDSLYNKIKDKIKV